LKSKIFIICCKCAALLLPLLVLVGCCRIHGQGKFVPYRVITEIHVRYENGALQASRLFSHPDELQPIIHYLRTLDPYGTPRENLERVQGSNFYITLHYSDGSQCLFHQRSDRYIRKNDGPWKRIDFRKAQHLSTLLETITRGPAQ